MPVPVAEQPTPAEQTPNTGSSGVMMYDAPTEPNITPRQAPRPATSDLPDWLQEITSTQQQQPQPRPLPAASRPAVVPTSNPSPPETPAEGAGSQHELPAWLRSDIEDIPPVGASVAPPADVPSLPSWLADQPGETPGTPTWLEQPAQQPADTWVSGAPGASAATPQETADTSLPSWLVATPAQNPDVAQQTPDAAEQAAPGNPPRPSEGAGMSTLPRWLLDDDEDDLPPPAVAPTNENTLPAWLREPQPAQTADDATPSWAQPQAQSGGTQPARDAAGASAAPPAPAPVAPDAQNTAALPSWLLEDDTPPPAAAAAAPGEGSNWLAATPAERNEPTLPSWLVDTEATPDTTTANAPQPAEGLPDWLVEQNRSAGAPAPSEEQPDWLQMIGHSNGDATDEPQPTQGQATPGRAGTTTAQSMNAQGAAPPLPAWLMPTQEEAAQQPVQQPSAPDDDVPAWLRDFTTDQPAAITQEPEPRAVDQWLTDTGPEPPTFAAIPVPDSKESQARIYDVRDEEEELNAATPREASSPLPGWLAGQSNQTGDPPWALPPWLSEADDTPAQPVATAAPAADPAQPSSLPAWLQPEDPATTVAAPTTNATPAWLQADDAAPSTQTNAVPAWLQAEDAASSAQQTAQFPAQATSQFPAQTSATIPTESLPATSSETAPDREESSSLMEQVIAEPEPEPVIAPAQPTRQRSIWINTIIPVLLFLLIVAGIIFLLYGPPLPTYFGGTSGPALASTVPLLQPTRPYSPGVARFEELAADLTPQIPVLIAYATDGSHGAELGALESGIMADLAERSSPLLLLATDPQGALLGRERAAGSSTTVLDLGYKPGGAVALARLAQNFGGAFASDANGRDVRADAATLTTFCGGGTCDLGRMGMVIVFADDAADVRTWAEQIGSVYPDLPLVYAVTAESAPYVRPYVLNDQTTMVAGMSDAVALGADTATFPGVDRRADAVAAGGALWGAVVLIGAIPAVIGGFVRRRGGRGNPWRR